MDDSYDRAEDYLESEEDYIEFEYDEKWANLPRKDKIDIINDIFYNGLPSYRNSASDLLDGIEARKSYEGEKITISRFKVRGRELTYIRGSNGRFKKRVR